ncbi:MAG: hypothetical protein ACI8UO_000234 [Verrucomicrobiales bacterium]|jgi:hypothetical protein
MSPRTSLLLFVSLFALATGRSSAQEDSGVGFGGAVAGDALEFLLPIDKAWTHVRAPRYDDENVLQSIMLSEIVTRRRDHVLDLEELTLALFDADGTVSLRMITAIGEYDLDEQKLKSRQILLEEPADHDGDGREETMSRTKIEHPKFDMWGDVLVFDTTTQSGTMHGNVRMEIFESDTDMIPIPSGSGESEDAVEAVPESKAEGGGNDEAQPDSNPQPQPANDKTKEESS